MNQSWGALKVLHDDTLPSFRPAVNQRWRCADEPWVNASGTTNRATAAAAVITNCGRGLQCRFHVARFNRLPALIGIVCPNAGETISLQFNPDPESRLASVLSRQPHVAHSAPSAECRADFARDDRPHAQSHRLRRNRTPCRCNHGNAPECRGKKKYRDRCGDRSDSRTVLMAACAKPQPPKSRRISRSRGTLYCWPLFLKISVQVSSVFPSTAATKLPIWSLGILAGSVLAAVLGSLPLLHDFGATNQDARYRFPAPNRSDRGRQLFQYEAPYPRSGDTHAAATKPPSPPRLLLNVVATAEVIPTQ